MPRYSAISVIYNPKSTGLSQKNAERLRLQLAGSIDIPVAIIPTQRAGHAQQLAYELSFASPRPLIISASGDGGYNEVINGVMRAQNEGAIVATGLLPSGNANDHYRSLQTGELTQHLLKDYRRRIDLLHITATHKKDSWQRYAHSYAGIGITAKVGSRLNQIDLNPINEWVVSARIIINSEPITILVDSQKRHYDSLIFSNIPRLAKVFVLSSASKVDDGQFEVVALQSKNKAAMLRQVAKALTGPAEEIVDVKQTADFSFTTLGTLDMQIDGEIATLEPDTTVTITAKKQILRCVL